MPDPTPDPTTLRAALAAALAHVGIVADSYTDQYDFDWTTTDRLIAELAQRGVALTPAAEAGPEPGLDVERLTKAYANAEATIRSGHNRVEQFWDVFAREYAALREPRS